MTARPHDPASWRRPLCITVALVLVMAAVLLAAGCTTNSIPKNQSDSAEFQPFININISSAGVNPGEDVKFSLVNRDFLVTGCPNYIPLYGVEKINDTGSWIMLPEFRHAISIPVNSSGGERHEPVYSLNTTGWEPGRYRIRLDCGGESGEFKIQADLQPVRTPCIDQKNVTPYILINPLGSYYFGETFEISGTTNAGVHEKIQYSISEPVIANPGGWKSPDPRSTSGIVQVTDNACGIQRWAIEVNGSEFGSWLPVLNLYVSTENNSIRNFSSFRMEPEIYGKYLPYPVVSGEPFTYHGTAPDPLPDIPANLNASGNISRISTPSVSTVHVWLFGERYTEMIIVPVNPDKSFDVPLSRFPDSRLTNGTYRMLFQYPKSGDSFDIMVKNGTYKAINTKGVVFLNFYDIFDAKISGFRVMDMLEQELKKPESKDRYSIISLVIS
jgi:hypothetical protein